MRLLLESAAVFAGRDQRHPGHSLRSLRAILDESRSLVDTRSDMSRQRALSRELHAAIVAASGNPQLHKMYMTVLNTFPDWMLYEYLFRHPECLEDEHAE